ncbi:minor capsid protein [Corallococcus exiguus]|uniref:minor capsid protein n=1 Tax=Corallococcus exiguus TaxID=83462 RepID=UPI001C12D70A|nr:minor capsid protein [Corallococcus exiguus]
MRDIASELAAVLEGAGLGLMRPPAPTANLFTAPMPEVDSEVPDTAVALIVTGGAGPQPYIGPRRMVYLSLGCQVRIRSAREDFEDGQQLALAVFGVLNLAFLAPFAVVRTEESAPAYLGTDGADRHRWVVNLVLGMLSASPGILPKRGISLLVGGSVDEANWKLQPHEPSES